MAQEVLELVTWKLGEYSCVRHLILVTGGSFYFAKGSLLWVCQFDLPGTISQECER